MKKGIHPEEHWIVLVMEGGGSDSDSSSNAEDAADVIRIKRLKVRSTYGVDGQEVRLDMYPSAHEAWNKGKKNTTILEHSRAAKQKMKYGGDDLF